MSADNWKKATRDALWAAWQASPEYRRALGNGTEFRYTSGELLKRKEFLPGICPIVALSPQGGDLSAINRRLLDQDKYNVLAEFVAVEIDDVEALVEIVMDATRAAWPTLATVRDNRLYEIEPTNYSYDILPTKDAARPLWVATTVLVCKYRRP
jgi:hypothetical protein